MQYPEHNLAHMPGPDDPMELAYAPKEELDRSEIFERLESAVYVMRRARQTMPAGKDKKLVDDWLNEMELEGW